MAIKMPRYFISVQSGMSCRLQLQVWGVRPGIEQPKSHVDEDAAWEMNFVAQTLLGVLSVLALQMG